MGGKDSKFLIAAASEVIGEIKTLGWPDRIKSALTRSGECSPPGNARVDIKNFIRCFATSASDTLEDRFLFVTLRLMVCLVHALFKLEWTWDWEESEFLPFSCGKMGDVSGTGRMEETKTLRGRLLDNFRN